MHARCTKWRERGKMILSKRRLSVLTIRCKNRRYQDKRNARISTEDQEQSRKERGGTGSSVQGKGGGLVTVEYCF